MIENIEYTEDSTGLGVRLDFEESHRYEIDVDPYTGDWNVLVEEEDFVLSDYFMARDDAVKFVLHREDILQNPDYNKAPDRC